MILIHTRSEKLSHFVSDRLSLAGTSFVCFSTGADTKAEKGMGLLIAHVSALGSQGFPVSEAD